MTFYTPNSPRFVTLSNAPLESVTTLVDFRYLWRLRFGNAIAKLDTLGLNLGG
jgi:hypothetical protein